MPGARLRIALVRGLSGQKPQHRRTVAALGLRKLHHTVEHEANDAVRGMIRVVAHLVRVEEID
jgi:large subunit ribosomal protein L30